MGWKEKLLHILKWARRSHSGGGLLTSEITQIFHDRFGMKYVDSNQVNKEMSRRLLKTPYITRKKINEKEFRWFITPKGEEILENGN